MDWLTLHRQSEAFAREAHDALRGGDAPAARANFRKAAEFESRALDCLDASKARTRGITAVSAASLWYKGGAFDEACALAYRQLGIGGLPEFAAEQLEDLVQSVYTERERAKYDVSFLPGMVSVSVRGGEVMRGAAPLDLIVDRVKTIQAMFYRVAEWLEDRPHRQKGPPSKEVGSLFEPWLLQDVPGSFQFSVAVKASPQFELFEKNHPGAGDIAKRFLEVVQTVVVDDTGDATAALVPQTDYRSTFRKLVRNLTPTDGVFDSIQLRVDGCEESPLINAQSRSQISKVIRRELPKPDIAAGEQEVEVRGVLRALDLNQDWLKVHVEDKGDVMIKGLSQAVDDVIGPMVNKPVLVRAVRPKTGALRFVDIELNDGQA
ncbi:hypothetical protein [Burkholderia pseudomallei]|uniref:hypothetical protein n=1 Tax=Burkholderia pseudomallei TaxID=28450 RepID=UPI0004664230|nr:hypothetical protein [Burkholderia pseudomallei]MBF3555384.1 hypothetical protein [Burkholderia pseudomallei]CAJ3214045.1 Uncharacterised protein [Burkholderia pseudomallei]CAJ4277860.1 Uncharacterised protein [Burkholderia pseudomallei]CAJ4379240.1 Uncharacterised protein [Burkholderia pseudomallei]CAJ5071045.1 Uncharacterised protein [Burkholderia pseudomallei]